VHDAYIRLVDGNQSQQWQGRRHFFGAAAEAMRRILVENARRKQALKHGGGWSQCDLEEIVIAVARPPEELLALHEGLEKLAEDEPLAAEVAKLRLVAGLTLDDIAQMLGQSRTAIHRHWTYARAWLRAELRDDPDSALS
jgi:RNA polymerase sigma factor (TIGR02999 family)